MKSFVVTRSARGFLEPEGCEDMGLDERFAGTTEEDISESGEHERTESPSVLSTGGRTGRRGTGGKSNTWWVEIHCCSEPMLSGVALRLISFEVSTWE